MIQFVAKGQLPGEGYVNITTSYDPTFNDQLNYSLGWITYAKNWIADPLEDRLAERCRKFGHGKGGVEVDIC